MLTEDGLAKLRPTPVPPPKSPPAQPRAVGGLGGFITAPFKAARPAAVAAVAAAGRLARGLADFTSGLMRWQGLAALAAVVSGGAAVFACSRSVDSEIRQTTSDLFNRFNSDEMWKARLTLERYYYLLSGDKIAPAELAKQTEEYFKSLVYQKAVLTGGRFADRLKFGNDREKQEEFFRQLDQSRRRVKNFYEDIMVFAEGGLITKTVNERILKARFHRNTADDLECFWLPVELGQNAALYQGRKPETDKQACQVIDWYRKRFPVAGRPVTPCVAYATRQPDFCIDPKAEALLSE
jgi:hypothetical protein